MSLIAEKQFGSRGAQDARLGAGVGRITRSMGIRTTCTVVPQSGVRQVVDLSGPVTGLGLDYEYFFNIIRTVAQVHGITDRRWFITYDASVPLPELDGQSVVFIFGDERALTPQLYERAGLVLKSYGTVAGTVQKPRPTISWVLDRLRITRNRYQDKLIRLDIGAERYAAIAAKTLTFPLGYTQQKELPLKPFGARSRLLWFAGSLWNTHASAVAIRKRLSGIPKLDARQSMARAVERLKELHPDWAIELRLVRKYQDSLAAGGQNYSETMMDTKICVVPRGTTPETQRFFEAMRSGCIVVSEPVPDFWFYRSAPAITVDRWRELPQVMEDLVADPARMQALHQAGRRWWEEICAPEAMARTIAAVLRGETTVAEVMARR